MGREYFFVVHLLIYAKTFAVYTQGIYSCSLAALIALNSPNLILKAVKLFEFIEACDNTANMNTWTPTLQAYKNLIISYSLHHLILTNCIEIFTSATHL